MNEVLALQEEHDLELGHGFHFQYAQYARVAFPARRTEAAIASLSEYLIAAGRDGEFYREALQLLDAVEARLPEDQRAARWPPGGAFRDCEECLEMVVLPAGRLALGRYEVTVGEYRAFATATGGGAGGGCDIFSDGGDSWRNPGFAQTNRHPVTCVNWHDAQAYVSCLRQRTGAPYRLQTEAEWTCPVGSYGTNTAGLSDMAGNVAELTQNCWQGDCNRPVTSDGSWAGSAESLRSAGCFWIRNDRRINDHGSRVSRTLA